MSCASKQDAGSRWITPCDCMPGDMVGRYTLKSYLGLMASDTGRSRRHMWLAECSCGREAKVSTNNFTYYRMANSGCVHCANKRRVVAWRVAAAAPAKQPPKPPSKQPATFKNSRPHITQAMLRLRMSESAIYRRMQKGWTLEEATTIPRGELPQRFQKDKARIRGARSARARERRGMVSRKWRSIPTQQPVVAQPQLVSVSRMLTMDELLRQFRQYGGIV